MQMTPWQPCVWKIHLILSIDSRKQATARSWWVSKPTGSPRRMKNRGVLHACVLLFNALSAVRKTDTTGKSTAGTQHNKWLIFTQQSSLNAATCQTLWSHFEDLKRKIKNISNTQNWQESKLLYGRDTRSQMVSVAQSQTNPVSEFLRRINLCREIKFLWRKVNFMQIHTLS